MAGPAMLGRLVSLLLPLLLMCFLCILIDNIDPVPPVSQLKHFTIIAKTASKHQEVSSNETFRYESDVSPGTGWDRNPSRSRSVCKGIPRRVLREHPQCPSPSSEKAEREARCVREAATAEEPRAVVERHAEGTLHGTEATPQHERSDSAIQLVTFIVQGAH